ncbi:hypothetical protein ACFE04_017291 [Oxalis oulophora]
MARSSGSPSPAQPKILLAKPGLVTTGPVAGKYGRGGGEDETASHRSRLPPSGSVNLVVSDLHINGSVYVFRLREHGGWFGGVAIEFIGGDRRGHGDYDGIGRGVWVTIREGEAECIAAVKDAADLLIHKVKSAAT